MTLDQDNKEWQDALQIINYTRRSLFLTGKAGTGKSTFLRYVAENTKKKHVVLAPTGIAAINAGGKHSPQLFQASVPSAATQRHPIQPTQHPRDTQIQRRTLQTTA